MIEEGMLVPEGNEPMMQLLQEGEMNLTRRRLVHAGGLGMLGLSLPQLLQARAGRSSEKSCILLCLYGGASQIDTWDMKPDAPAEVRGPYKPIQTATPGIRITE